MILHFTVEGNEIRRVISLAYRNKDEVKIHPLSFGLVPGHTNDWENPSGLPLDRAFCGSPSWLRVLVWMNTILPSVNTRPSQI